MPKAALLKYRQKRDFTKTGEPSGQAKVLASDHLRFVIQKHAASRLHFDLRLEVNGVFKSWAVTKGPSIDPADKRLAVEVEDHPLDYGDFEGTIPKGEYGGGTVQLWDRGFWAPEATNSPEAALESGELKFILAGQRLIGGWVLVRIHNNRGRDKHTNWLLIKQRDQYAKPGGTAALLEKDESVASGRAMREIADGVGKAPKPFHARGAQGTQGRCSVAFQSDRAFDTAIPSPSAGPVTAPEIGVQGRDSTDFTVCNRSTTVDFDNSIDDGKPQSGRGSGIAACLVASIETIEDLRQVAASYANTRISHLNKGAPVRLRGHPRDRTAPPGV